MKEDFRPRTGAGLAPGSRRGARKGPGAWWTAADPTSGMTREKPPAPLRNPGKGAGATARTFSGFPEGCVPDPTGGLLAGDRPEKISRGCPGFRETCPAEPAGASPGGGRAGVGSSGACRAIRAGIEGRVTREIRQVIPEAQDRGRNAGDCPGTSSSPWRRSHRCAPPIGRSTAGARPAPSPGAARGRLQSTTSPGRITGTAAKRPSSNFSRSLSGATKTNTVG